MRLTPGEKKGEFATKRMVQVVGTGNQTYLWVGNDDAGENMACFGTMTGPALRQLARSILRRAEGTK